MLNYRKPRLALTFVVVALLLAVVPFAMAQDTFGLSADEFAALGAANDASANADSYDYAFTLTANMSAEGETADATINGSGSIDTVAGAFSLEVTGSATAEGQTIPFNVGLRAVGDSLYGTLDGAVWYQLDLEETGTLLTDQVSEAVPFDLEALASGDTSSLADSEAMMNATMGLMTLDPTNYVVMSVTGTEAVNGVESSVYFIDLDPLALLTSEQVTAFIAAAVEQDPSMAGMDPAMITGAFNALDVNVTQYVGNSLIQRTVLDLVLDISGDPFGAPGESVASDIAFDITLSNYGAASEVVAPEGAIPFSLEDFMGGGF